MQLVDIIAWTIFAFAVIATIALLIVILPNLGRFGGYLEEWHTDCDLALRGKFYNGRRTYYVLFVPVFRTGFYHSTSWRD